MAAYKASSSVIKIDFISRIISQFYQNYCTGKLENYRKEFFFNNHNKEYFIIKKYKSILMKLIVTGGAGFIGFHLIKKLLEMNEEILCIDNINDYYDINLKTARLDNLKRYSKDNHKSFIFKQESLENNEKISEIFNDFNPEIVVNLAAQAGVRYSLINPSAYIQSNLVGFANILENCKNKKVKHLIYASSSSVYGGNKKFFLKLMELIIP